MTAIGTHWDGFTNLSAHSKLQSAAGMHCECADIKYSSWGGKIKMISLTFCKHIRVAYFEVDGWGLGTLGSGRSCHLISEELGWFALSHHVSSKNV